MRHLAPAIATAVLIVLLSGGSSAQDRRAIIRGNDAPQTAERRLALVIGNDAYSSAPVLKNARNDATSMAGALEELGFMVTRATDVRRDAFGSTLARFADSIGSNDLALFFFAGHGVQVDNENYLLPVDVDMTSPTSVRLNAVGANQIAAALQRARLSVLVLDACRTIATFGGRNGAGGLAHMEARGSLIAFATGVNQVASDNPAGANGLFTGELIRTLREPGLSIREVFFRVKQRVYERSSGAQFPTVIDGLLWDLQLRPAATAAATVPAVRPSAPPAVAPSTPAASGAAAIPSSQRFAYIVLQRVANESKAGQAGTAKIKAAAGRPQSEIDALQKSLQDEFQKRLEPLINDYARANGIGMVFNGPDAGLVWADSRLDVSADLIRRLDGASVTPQVSVPDSRVAYVVLQRVANETADGRVATTRIQALQQKKAAELNSLNAQLATLQQRQDTAGSTLSTAAAAELSREIERTKTGIARFTEDAQAEVQALQTTLQEEFQKAFEPVLNAYAGGRQLGFVFNGPDAGLVWADSRLDVSADIIRSMDQGRAISSTATLPETRMGYVVLPRIANETRTGKAATVQVQALQQKRASELADKNQQLTAVQDRMTREGNVMSQATRTDVQRQIDRLKIEIQRFTEDSTAEVTELQQKLQGEFQKSLEPVLNEVASRLGFSYLFNGPDAGLVFGHTPLDVTADVIKAMDAK